MGKPGKLRNSMKAFQGIMSSITPAAPTSPFCISSIRTLSCEDLSPSLNSIYCTPLESSPSSEASTSGSSSPHLLSPFQSEALQEDALISKRFFFSPCNSKSITGREEMEEQIQGETKSLAWDSIAIAMASRDPYGDFRSSMEEMVVALGLWDWSSLKELLNCYLRVNEKKTHKIIMLAFVDLLMDLKSESSSFSSL